MNEIVRASIQITPTYKRQVWAEKLSKYAYKVLRKDGSRTGEMIITMGDVINERKAKMNLHYGELEIVEG